MSYILLSEYLVLLLTVKLCCQQPSVGIALNTRNVELGSNGQCRAGEDEGTEFDK